MKKRFGWKKGIIEPGFHLFQVQIRALNDVFGEFVIESYPIRASVDDNAMGRFPLGKAPHVILTFEKNAIQPLFLNEFRRFATVAFHEIFVAMLGKKSHQLLVTAHRQIGKR